MRTYVQTGCGWQAAHQSAQGARFFQTMEHDGRDAYSERREGVMLLCFEYSQDRFGEVSVRRRSLPHSQVHYANRFVVALPHRTDPKRNDIVLEYLLPDFSANRHGRVKKPDDILSDSDQVLFMNNERFAVPEILFRPNDIGS